MKILNISLNGINNKNKINFKNNQNEFLRNDRECCYDVFEASLTKKCKYRSGSSVERYFFDRSQDRKTCVINQNQKFTIIRESDRNTCLIELEANSENKNIKTIFYISNKHKEDSYCTYTVKDGNEAKEISLKWNKNDIYKFDGSKEDAKTLKNALVNLRTMIGSKAFEKDFGRNKKLNSQIAQTIAYLSDLSNIAY